MKLVNVPSDFLRSLFLRIRYPNLRHAFNIKSHLTFDERVVLYNLSKGCINIVEIGSYIGASACCLGAAAKKTKCTQILCIDTWNNDAMTEGNRDTWKEFLANTSNFSEFIVPIRGLSSDVVQDVRRISSSIDLLFIDGDHSYDSVRSDWQIYKTFLKSGSIVVFHDYAWAEGVRRVIKEDVLQLVSSQGQLPNMWWGILA